MCVSLQKEMVKRRYDAYNGLSSLDFAVIATEYTPLYRWLGSRASTSVQENEDGVVDLMSSEDEIEDW